MTSPRVSPGEIRTAFMRRYDRCVMNNTERGHYVECMVALALGSDWEQTPWDWAPWDCQHKTSKIRIEIKQSAARQSWDRETLSRRRSPSFDIAPRKGYWTEAESRWVISPGRPAHIYIFAWHDERRSERADHRDPDQWLFFVAPEKRLPDSKKSIGLTGLREISPSHGIAALKGAVENACPPQEALKDTFERARRSRYRATASPSRMT